MTIRYINTQNQKKTKILTKQADQMFKKKKSKKNNLDFFFLSEKIYKADQMLC